MSKLQGIFETGLTTVNASTDRNDDVGTIRIEDNGKVYKYVKFLHGTSTVDVTFGDCVVYSGSTGFSAVTVTADYSDASGTAIGGGVIQAACTTTNQFLWVQVGGML